MIYMMQAGADGPVKIGSSEYPEQRIAEVQTAHWMRLRIIRKMHGGSEMEKWLHARFRDNRIRGEWFAFDHQMLTVRGPRKFVTEEKIKAPEPRTKIGRAVKEFREQAGLSVGQLAAAVGVFRNDVVEIERGKQPRKATVDALEGFFKRKLWHLVGGEQ